MFISEGTQITHDARFFLEPGNPHHRQYEALRAFFVEGLSSAKAAARFGYSVGSFRVLVHKFRHGASRDFFSASAKGPQAAPKSDPLRAQIIALRKQNLSIYDISQALAKEEHPLSPVAISLLLKEEGFARLPRRGDDERPATARPIVADVADVRQLDLTPRHIKTDFGGLFLFLPWLATIPFDRILSQVGLPGSKMVPAGCAMRAL